MNHPPSHGSGPHGGPPPHGGGPHGHGPGPHGHPPHPPHPYHYYHGLPPGARPYAWGGYSYFFVGGRFLYPYLLGGQTVYVNVDVDEDGKPEEPPPAESIQLDVNTD